MNKKLTTDEVNELINTLKAVGVKNADRLEADGTVGIETITAINYVKSSYWPPAKANQIIITLKSICPAELTEPLIADGNIGPKTMTCLDWLLDTF